MSKEGVWWWVKGGGGGWWVNGGKEKGEFWVSGERKWEWWVRGGGGEGKGGRVNNE